MLVWIFFSLFNFVCAGYWHVQFRSCYNVVRFFFLFQGIRSYVNVYDERVVLYVLCVCTHSTSIAVIQPRNPPIFHSLFHRPSSSPLAPSVYVNWSVCCIDLWNSYSSKILYNFRYLLKQRWIAMMVGCVSKRWRPTLIVPTTKKSNISHLVIKYRVHTYSTLTPPPSSFCTVTIYSQSDPGGMRYYQISKKKKIVPQSVYSPSLENFSLLLRHRHRTSSFAVQGP